MITRVEVSRWAEKQLAKLPVHIVKKLQGWIEDVEKVGLLETRRKAGIHDEPLQGQRWGQRSIRLNREYRAIYIIKKDRVIEFVSIEEVSKHDY